MDYFFIGEAELVTAFRFAGVEGRAVSDAEGTLAAFHELTRQGAAPCKILILSEGAADALGDELTAWQLSGKYPLIVEVPDLAGHHSGRKTIVDAIREAIGIHV